MQLSQARQHGDVGSQDVVHISCFLQPGEGQLMIVDSNCSQRDGYRHAIPLIRQVEQMGKNLSRLIVIAIFRMGFGKPAHQNRHAAMFDTALEGGNRFMGSSRMELRHAQRIIQLKIMR